MNFFGHRCKDEFELFLNEREGKFQGGRTSDTNFRFDHSGALISKMFQRRCDVDFACSFADAVQNHVDQNVGASASATITETVVQEKNSTHRRRDSLAMNDDR